jgi:hypothetical protein
MVTPTRRLLATVSLSLSTAHIVMPQISAAAISHRAASEQDHGARVDRETGSAPAK